MISLKSSTYEREGVSKPFSFTITEAGREISAFPFKWYQVTVTNDGEDNDLYLIKNDQSPLEPTVLQPGERVEFDYDKPTVWRVKLWTDAGKTAAARIDTER